MGAVARSRLIKGEADKHRSAGIISTSSPTPPSIGQA
jgi:hypothetical protein